MNKSRRLASSFKESEKHKIIKAYLKGGQSKNDIWREFTGQDRDHAQILRWMRQLGYLEKPLQSKPLSLRSMPSRKKKKPSLDELQNKIKQLEKQLLDSQLKEEAYRRMIDIAEKELKVSIRKKSDTR